MTQPQLISYIILSAHGRPVLSFDDERRATDELKRVRTYAPSARLIRETRVWEEVDG